MKNVFSVAQVNTYIKNVFVQDYVLNDLWIQGEISNYKKHSSGHAYFTLKDETSAICCVLFSRYQDLAPYKLEDGMRVVARGYVSVYERSGQYQLYVQQVQLDGIGALYQRFEELKLQLEQKGYFDQELKKPIPKFAKKIGVVTSSTGAVIKDIINVSKRRNPYVQLVLYPTLVQGPGAAESIVRGIQYLDNIEDIDIIIIGRGGGSIEDLWAFNEAQVAEAIFQSKKPIISAVGHETDFTIADFVSDLRAPTPSAAAEIAVSSVEAIEDLMNQYHYKLRMCLERKLKEYHNKLQHMQLRLNYVNPMFQIRENQQFLMELENRLKQAMDSKLKDHRVQMKLFEEKLKALSPLRQLEKGFAFVTDAQGQIITSVKKSIEGESLNLRLADGELEVQVMSKRQKRWDK